MNNISFLFFILIFFTGCNSKQPLESYQDLYGLYKSSTFIEPGAKDGGVDIQLAGGYFNITLNNNYQFNAEVLIPDSIYSNYAEGLWHYDGSYTIKYDTLEFYSQYFIIKKFRWDKQNQLLESFEASVRGKPFKIILNKCSSN